LLERVTEEKMLDWLEDAASQSSALTLEDPRRECSAESVNDEQQRLRSWVQERPAELRSFWGL
ncbi:MAG TPA: hypothetical protein PLA94_30900, partial [Myxococcota bacterium]|nr:hypothetical protein [Myxococcota bacterium]